MSREDPKINLRVPLLLKEKLHEAATLNGRSVNAESVYRLETSFLNETKAGDLLTPEEARALAKAARKNLYTVLMNACITKINTAAKNGSLATNADVSSLVGDDYFDDESAINKDVTEPVVKALTKLGYIVEVDGSGLYIKF